MALDRPDGVLLGDLEITMGIRKLGPGFRLHAVEVLMIVSNSHVPGSSQRLD